MSLLMKALEKAAKDRGEVRTEPAAAPEKKELALEPIAVPAAPPLKGEPAAQPAATPSPRPDIPARPAAAPPRPGPAITPPPAPPAPSTAREQAQVQAGTVLQAQAASRPAAGGVGAYVRARPVMVIGTLAAVFAVGFGVYAYVQIFHPGLLLGQQSIVAKGPPPAAALKPPAPAPGAASPGEPLAAETVLKEAEAESAAAAQARAAALTPQPPPPPPAPEETAARGSTIVVSPGSAEPVLNPLLGQAYAALQAGQTDTAQRLYDELLKSEPRNVDALLALAAMAGQRGSTDEAVRLYLQILELDPRHTLAQSGLIALLGRADPLAAESKLKQLIAREPSPWLYFTLGNLYADQSLWAQAQQAWFQAHHLEPANPDYAYNLAVGLEHVSQPKLALGFYRRAVELAAARGRANFDPALARERVAKLAQQVE
jgi:tetratricopeptide (TPR) repeat protein